MDASVDQSQTYSVHIPEMLLGLPKELANQITHIRAPVNLVLEVPASMTLSTIDSNVMMLSLNTTEVMAHWKVSTVFMTMRAQPTPMSDDELPDIDVVSLSPGLSQTR